MALTTQDEKDRLVEILLYYYFNKQSEETLKKPEFWGMVRSICMVYDVDATKVGMASRVLMDERNRPTDEEAYYLLSEIGLTVRPIRAMTGIYWQKQKALRLEFEANGNPIVTRKLVDPTMRYHAKNFVIAMYRAIGVFSNMTLRTLEQGLKI